MLNCSSFLVMSSIRQNQTAEVHSLQDKSQVTELSAFLLLGAFQNFEAPEVFVLHKTELSLQPRCRRFCRFL